MLILFFVFKGNILNNDNSKQNDFQSIKTTFERIIKTNFSRNKEKVFYRLIACDPLCQEALKHLSM